MANVPNADRPGPVMLRPFTARRREAWQPWYGLEMKAQPQPQLQPQSQINGQPARRPRQRPELADDGLYRYAPVPPVHRDADGYLLEDGMSQTDEHQTQTSQWCYMLKRRLPDATVCADLPLHYHRGDTNKTLVPDLFVALRAPRQAGREKYMLWENPVPELVVEMLSETTSSNDTGSKRRTYEHLGVREYWLFDPMGFELPTPLVGLRLRDGRYREIDADAAGLRRSQVLGLDLYVGDGELRFRDPATGEDLRNFDRSEDRGNAEKARADAAERGRAAEKARADALERELARLR